MNRLLFIFAILCGSAFAQLTAPTLYPPSGSFINSVQVGFYDAGTVQACYTVDGTTPTAATPGTCDNNGHIYSTSTNAQWATIATVGTTTLKAIVTAVGQTNSSVTTGTYTITSQAATNPIAVPTPTKVTNATGNFTYTEPFLMKDGQGRTFLFYSGCNCAAATDGTGTAWVAYATSSNGSSWTLTNPNVSCAYSGDPSSGCFYDVVAGNLALIPSGGGLDASGTMILLISSWVANSSTVNGIVVMRCANSAVNDCTQPANWTAPTFLTTPTYTLANSFINPTANLVSIPAGASGVTGSCFTSGCSFITVLGENAYANHVGLVFTYNSGATWSDPVSLPAFYPYATEEEAILWLPGSMKLMLFIRPGTTSEAIGGPTNITVATSTNLGASWNSYTPVATAYYGVPSNLPIGPCPVAPQVGWVDTFTRPSIAIDPQNSAVATLLYGERLSCNSVASFRWQTVSFNIANAFAANGQDLPLPQVLNLDPVTTTQIHTTYSFMIPLNSSQLLFAYEQGNTTTSEDIYATTISYAPGMQVGGGISYWPSSITFK